MIVRGNQIEHEYINNKYQKYMDLLKDCEDIDEGGNEREEIIVEILRKIRNYYFHRKDGEGIKIEATQEYQL